MEQTARLDGGGRTVRLCLDDNGNVTVEEFLMEGERATNGNKVTKRGWYFLWRHVVNSSNTTFGPTHFREE